MCSDASIRRVAVALIASLVAGCATGIPRGADAPPVEPAPVSADTPGATAPGDTTSSDSGVIEAVLAERRRGDFPELELGEAGFTVTEQVRVGSAARTDYERAIGLLRVERYADGIAVLEQIIEASPDLTAPYIDLGIAYGRIGDLEQAERALSAASLLSPDNPVVLNELGIVYRKTGRFAEARASYEQALAVFGGFHFARRNLAVLCDLYLADPACAIANYRAYLDAAGSDREVEIWVADLENRIGN